MDLGGDKGNIRSEINVTPLVDVCLVLLIIFMVVTPMLGTGDITLPQTAQPSKKPEDQKQIVLNVKYGNPPILGIHDDLGDNIYSRPDFEKQLDEDYQRNSTRPVVIKADTRLSWKQVRDVMRIAKDAGFENVGLITDKKQKPGQ
ncbi:MAG TPA: biopolymer transporter ExbD [Thermoanaerobaculia bacterium]|jgi:biopolymer transport protein TolR|nr:biopolymer transporter ExbD [Thermoanaerobaculia bacterium]